MRFLYKSVHRYFITRLNKLGRKRFSNEASLQQEPLPDFIQERNYKWEVLKLLHQKCIEDKSKDVIKITLPDGKLLEGLSWSTTPYDIAQSISTSLSKKVVISKVNGELWDLDRPFEEDSTLQLLEFNQSEDAKQVFWHSSAHILGEAVERLYNGHLCIGPPIDNGFYYDFFTNYPSIKQSHYTVIQDLMKNIIEEKQTFERLVIKKEDLLTMFKYNKYKVQLIQEKVNTETTTAYKCGSLIDLCLGPHVRHTGVVKHIKIYNNSTSHWKGDINNDPLHRIYGISFPNSKQLKEWAKNWEEAALRNHKLIGTKQKLFFFHELSPGSCFFTREGTIVYDKLVNFIKDEQSKRDFLEVITPNIFKSDLWRISGHWDHYSKDMFSFQSDNQTYNLKPMNCPGHCLIYHHTPKYWNQLPIRYSEFGVLHRNENPSALSGLTRVRRFQQDDAHIFCRPDQIKAEIKNLLDYLSVVYNTLGFSLNISLSTRPDDFMGDINLWSDAEQVLQEVLNDLGIDWKLNPKDGAFYGPKIDITVMDAIKRKHQCATIQLDFQLPIKFDLHYISADDTKLRPVILHCAILGSVERMIAIITESYCGKLPFWLSPRQVYIVPVSSIFLKYAKKVEQQLLDNDIIVNTSSGENHMRKMIKKAQLEQYNYILIIGQNEVSNGTVNVRTRDNDLCGEFNVNYVIEKFKCLKTNKVLECTNIFN